MAQESRETLEETVAPGDSGGPLFLRAGAQSEYYIAGVASWITWHGTNQERAYWATTGSLEVWQWSVSSDGLARRQSVLDSANAEWLLSTLGGDADADGVPDEIDNCATRRCVRLGWDRDRCFNPLQEDEDGDIVGDACERIGLPRPIDVIVHPVSLHLGVPVAGEFPPLSASGKRRWHSHVVVTFAEPVPGPVLLGAGRFRGYGFLRPLEAMR